MCRFLRFAVSRALAKNPGSLKEYTVGVEVFDRPVSFEPALDPIVRVEARRLRSKLCKYFENEGRLDEIVIELPKGGYLPKFSLRERPGISGTPAGGGRGIAVLPFQNLSIGEDAAYFGEGLTWELTHHLTRIPDLRVVAWNSAARIRGEQQDLAGIREKLKVDSILTGSVRLSGERLRVVVQIIDTASGAYLWSETFDGTTGDVFTIQERIAQQIVKKLTAQSKSPAPQLARYNPEAYRIYLRARFESNQRTESALRQSLESFHDAARIDPNFALAYAGIADTCALLADYGFEPPLKIVPQAKAAALRALELDSSLAEAHCSLAFITGFCEWNWAGSEVHYLRALDLNPGYATAHHWFAVDYLAYVGRLDEALEELEIARQLDPLSSIINEGRGMLLMYQRNYREAAAHYRSLAQTDPQFYKAYGGLGRTLLQMGSYKEAIEQFEMARKLVGDVPSLLGAMGQAYARDGQTEKARGLLALLHELAASRHIYSTAFAMIHLGLGEPGRALEWLEKGVSQRDLPLASLGAHPAYDELRGDPRFSALLTRVGLSR